MDGNWAVGIMNMIDKIVKLVYINVLWIVFTVLGLIVFGLMPATASVNALIRDLLSGKEVTNIFSEFWVQYKTSFIKSNLVGIVFIIIAIFLYVDIRILLGTDSIVGKMILAVLFMISYIFFATLLHFFPIFNRYEMKTFNYLKLSITLAMSHPFTTILMVLWLFVVGVLSLKYTVIIPLLFISLISIGSNWLSMKRIEKKNLLED
ncbi:YesL family protein [Aquibacillus kalidii]|uniref:YesL family protein n=1 Tax=Aquibacillus kalidii TaxID=2762597 RepID=UPI001648A080|nr:DUF624 domain-containing protein [Aquibacillus kalidii]